MTENSKLLMGVWGQKKGVGIAYGKPASNIEKILRMHHLRIPNACIFEKGYNPLKTYNFDKYSNDESQFWCS